MINAEVQPPAGVGMSAIADGPRWYAAYTYPRHEKVVETQLEQKAVDVFLPTFSVISRWKDRRVRTAHPVFPGYVFTRIYLRDRIRVVSTPSVIRIVSFKGMPAPISDQEIEAVRVCLAGGSIEPHPFIGVGERVNVRSGPFEGISGIVIRRTNQCKLVVSIGLIHQSFALEIRPEDLDKVTSTSFTDDLKPPAAPAGAAEQYAF